jgi:hypothetical protein
MLAGGDRQDPGSLIIIRAVMGRTLNLPYLVHEPEDA